MESYRNKFEKYYGIKLSSNYEIHHIDLNHKNNEIKNLMILPEKIHHDYHSALISAAHYFSVKDGFVTFNAKAESVASNQLRELVLNDLESSLLDVAIWYDYKLFMDGKMPNVHRIELGALYG